MPKRKVESGSGPSKKAKLSPLSGAVICQTGTLSVARKDFTKLISNNGGKTSSSVTGSTTLLVADPGAEGTTKWNAALSKDVPIVAEQFIYDVIDGSAELDSPDTLAGTPAPAAPAPAPEEEEDSDDEEDEGSALPLEGVVICQTGTLSKSRAAFTKIVKNNGGSCSTTVNAKTTLLVADVGAEGTTKYNAALAKGVPIVPEQYIYDLIDGTADINAPQGLTNEPVAKEEEEEEEDDDEEDEDEDDEPVTQPLEGIVISHTGRAKAAFTNMVKNNGGSISKSVTAKTSLLVAEPGDEKTAKWKGAVKHGVPIVAAQFINDLIDGSASLDAPVVLTEASEEDEEEEDGDEETDGDASGPPLAGITICQTGKLSVTRKVFNSIITKNGGKVSGSVTSTTDLLVADEGAMGTKKWDTAEEKAVPIVAEQFIYDLIDGSASMSSPVTLTDSTAGFIPPAKPNFTIKKSNAKSLEIPAPYAWSLDFNTNEGAGPPTMGFGLYVSDSAVWAGLEDGRVLKVNKETGTIMQVIKLPSACKTIVADHGWMYCGCDDGRVYDITNPKEPMLMYELAAEGSSSILWLDICDGHVAVSTANGRVHLVNSEGEEKWSNSQADAGGWMVRADLNGIYHGSGSAVRKLTFAEGAVIWTCPVKDQVLFGDQSETALLSSSACLTRIDKETGNKIDSPVGRGLNFPSCALSDSGPFFGAARILTQSYIECYNEKGEATAYMSYGNSNPMSMAYHDKYLYAIGSKYLRKIDVGAEAIASAKKGTVMQSKTVSGRESKVKAVEPTTSVSSVSDAGDGVVVECYKEGSKVRVRAVSNGYHKTWNVQFPRALREVGASFVVDELIEAQTGGFYRAKGSIKKLS